MVVIRIFKLYISCLAHCREFIVQFIGHMTRKLSSEQFFKKIMDRREG